MDKSVLTQQINEILAEQAEFWSITDLQVNYLSESLTLKLVSLKEEEIIKSTITFNQMLSLYIHQGAEIETYRLNTFEDSDPLLLSEISCHLNGFGHIHIKSLDRNLTEIETINSKTNFYFQVNNKDYFFVEANSVTINDKTFHNLIEDEKILKNPY